MTGPRAPLVGDVDLARRIERAEAGLMAAATRAAGRRDPATGSFVLPLGGGAACFAGAASPFTKVAGLGFAGVPPAERLDEVEAAFAAVGVPTSVELSSLADPELGPLLGERGYRLAAFENVLGRALHGDERVVTPGVEVRRSADDELDAWLEVVLDGVAQPDVAGVPWQQEFPRGVVADAERDFAAAGVARYAAWCDGVLAGGGELHVAGGVALLAGAATTPAHRRRGVHAALLSARLADAAAAGCDVAVVTTQPGSTSQQNVQRRGFDLLYTRAVLVCRSSRSG